MPAADIIRISDYERRSRHPDAVSPRDPCDADVIIFPVVRTERVAGDAGPSSDIYTRGL